MNVIVPLTNEHSAHVALLHLKHLHTQFRGVPGQKLLSAYYGAVACGIGASGYVAERNGTITGFICGIWDSAAVKAVMFKKYWPAFCIWGVAQACLEPRLIKDSLCRIFGARNKMATGKVGYELRPIVLAPAARGAGLAGKLVETLLMDAANRGFPRVYLYTEADNLVARTFYEKEGFREGGSVERSGMLYLRYERLVSKAL